MSKLSKQNLITYLSDPHLYKNTKPYLQHALCQHQQTVLLIQQSLLFIFHNPTINVISKMHALKFFKDIFESGNMDLVDSLDEKVEEHILKLAMYGKDKRLNVRGEDYFVVVEGREQTEQNRTIGISYVIFAMEIVVNFAEWYGRDQEQEESRFKAFERVLREKGVQFPTVFSYFKPADRTRFENNYQAWKQKLEKSVKAEELEKNKKVELQPTVIKETIKEQPKPLTRQKEEIRLPSEPKTPKTPQQPKKFFAQSAGNEANMKKEIAELKSKLENAEKRHQLQVKELKKRIQNLQDNNEQLKEENKKIQSQRNNLLEEYGSVEKQTNRMKSQYQNLQEQLSQTKKLLKALKQKYEHLQRDYNQKCKRLQTQPIQELRDTMTKRISEQATRVNILSDDLSRSKQIELELNKEVHKLRRDLLKMKSQQQSLSNLSSQRQPLLQNKVLKQKCRLLQLKLKQSQVMTPTLRISGMARSQHVQPSHQLSSRNYLHQSGNNFFKAKTRISTNLRMRLNHTEKLFKDSLKESVVVDEGGQVGYDSEWMAPLSLKMYLWRNACLGKKKAFFDSDQVEIRVGRGLRLGEFFLWFHSKSKKEMWIGFELVDTDTVNFYDSDFREKVNLGAGRTIENKFNVELKNISHRYARGLMSINGEKLDVLIPITLLSFCEFSKISSSTELKQLKQIKTEEFPTDFRVLSIEEYFNKFCKEDSSSVFEAEAAVKLGPQSQANCFLIVRNFRNSNTCVIRAYCDKQSKISEEFSHSLLQLLIFCFRSAKK